MKLMRLFTVGLITLFSLSCSLGSNPEGLAREGVKSIHRFYNDRDFKEIYSLSSEGFKKTVSVDSFISELTSRRDQLGAQTSSKEVALRVEFTDSTEIRQLYRTEFENGKGSELLTWILEDGRLALEKYEFLYR